MSETLPPVTGTGVTLQFIFPFDRSMPREASVNWRRTVGSQTVDTEYASITQGGNSSVVHEQITFPGDCWVVISRHDRLILSLHVATGEREQRVVISAESRRRVNDEQPQQLHQQSMSTVLGNDHEDDDVLAAAVAASLRTVTAVDVAANAEEPMQDDNAALRHALVLSKRLADEHRARLAERAPARAPVPDPEAMRMARLRRFGSG